MLDLAAPAARVGHGERWWRLAIALWAVAVVAGMALLWRYKLTPVAPNDPPSRWPADSTIERDPERPTLLMLVHPKCPCSRASLAELARLMGDTAGRAKAIALFVRPEGVPSGWEQSDTWQSASRIPGVVVRADDEEVEAHRFGATVSGYTLLYGVDGRLLYHGGITGARGHEGDNSGLRRIVSLIRDGHADADRSPTFGCELDDTGGALGRRADAEVVHTNH
ncbi:MAG TPA: hypothetical protein VF765_34090 [Polyangiaceae bacterium]